MRKVNLNNLEAGMVTADTVATKSGQTILEKGVTLTKSSILRLSFYNIKEICIECEDTDAPEIIAAEEQPVRQKPSYTPAYSQKVKASQQFQTFQFDHSFVLNSIKTSFENYVFQKKPLNTDDLLKQVTILFDSCKTSLDLFDMLNNMRSYDDSTYAHSLNVALICRRFGKWLKVSPDVLDTITLCGLLHDIGKLLIPNDILNKPGQYTDEEFELVKKHPRYGYDLLKNLPIDPHIKIAALLHHERCDGSGYPMGLSKDIDNYALIVAVADVYDAMTAARPHRPPLCPFQVISLFEKDGLQKYNPKYVLTFLKHIAQTYQSNRIILNDGRTATIVMLNQNHLSKPIVQFDDGECLDLSTQSELHIQSIL